MNNNSSIIRERRHNGTFNARHYAVEPSFKKTLARNLRLVIIILSFSVIVCEKLEGARAQLFDVGGAYSQRRLKVLTKKKMAAIISRADRGGRLDRGESAWRNRLILCCWIPKTASWIAFRRD